MRPSLAILSAAMLAAPSVAAAQAVTFSFGASVVSEYEANGLRQSDGVAFQPYVEAEINGFYAGIWASNVSEAIIGAGDTLEYDLYAGFRNTVGAFSYDVQYAHYFYNGSGACCGEAILSLAYDVTPQFNLGTRFAWDPNSGTVNSRLFGSYAVTDQVSVNAHFGTISNGGHNYWSIGGSYAVNDTVSLGVAYHGTNLPSPDDSLFVVSISFAFGTTVGSN
jgi:uncharacterized protein (TIGR02001 family)